MAREWRCRDMGFGVILKTDMGRRWELQVSTIWANSIDACTTLRDPEGIGGLGWIVLLRRGLLPEYIPWVGRCPLGLWSYLSELSGWAFRLVNVWSVLFDGEGGVLKIEAEVRGSRAGRFFRPWKSQF